MNIGVIIVTYNRLEKLKKCLRAYERQNLSPAFLLVIDNHSTDGTQEYLNAWADTAGAFQRIVRRSESNLGGAGGFRAGMEAALQLGSDWIWLADDDAYPQPDCLSQIQAFYESLLPKEQAQIVTLCAKVMDNDGLSPLHRRKMHSSFLQLKELPLQASDFEAPVNEINLFSFVGSLIRRDTAEKAGLPREDYFIFYDDTEYSLRIGQFGKIMCISNAVIIHDSLENNIASYNWKNFYMFRNKMYTYLHYFTKMQCLVEFIKEVYMIFKYYSMPATLIQFHRAIRDAISGRLGKDDRYLP